MRIEALLGGEVYTARPAAGWTLGGGDWQALAVEAEAPYVAVGAGAVPRVVMGPMLALGGRPKPEQWDLSVAMVVHGSASDCRPVQVYTGDATRKLVCTSQAPLVLLQQGDYQLVRFDFAVILQPDNATEYAYDVHR